MHPPGADTVLVRHAELGVKSEAVRRRMEDRLAENLLARCTDRGVEAGADHRRTRILLRTPDPSRAAQCVADTPGLASVSPALSVPPELDAITEAVAGTAGAHYDGGSVAVRARRAGPADAHPFTSGDIERQGGDALGATVDHEGVDLENPDFQVGVECRRAEAYVFCETLDGPGGLPVGTQAPVVALLSGGIDSPVAAYEMLRRGCPVVPLYVDLGPYGGPDHRARAEAAARRLARLAPNHDLALRVAPGGPGVEAIADTVGAERMLVLRRFMLRVAAAVAEQVGAVGVVTGEAVGQKSSQTAANLAATAAGIDLPVHRPLVTRDKASIVEQARDLGTFEDATVAAGCDRIAPQHPETNATPAAVDAALPDGFDALVAAAVEGLTAGE